MQINQATNYQYLVTVNQYLSAVYQTGKSTLVLMLAMDNELMILPLGILIAKYISVLAAPLITAMLELIYYLNVSILLPSSMTYSYYAGQLINLNFIGNDSGFEQKTPVQHALMTHQIHRLPMNSLLSSLPIIILLPALIFSKSWLVNLGLNTHAAKITQDFFRWFSPFYLFFSIRLIHESALVNFQQKTPAMLASLGSIIFAIFVILLFCYYQIVSITNLSVLLGLELVITAVSYVCLSHYLLPDLFAIQSYFAQLQAEDYQQIYKFLLSALPLTVITVTDVISGLMLAIFAGQLGDHELTVQNAAAQYLNFNYYILSAATQTMSITIGKAQESQLCLNIIAVIYSTLILQLPCYLILTISPEIYTKLINGQSTVISPWFYQLNALYAMINGISFNLVQAARNLNDIWFSSVITCMCTLSGLGLSYGLSHYSSLNIIGLPIGISIGLLLNSVILSTRIRNLINYKQMYMVVAELGEQLITKNPSSFTQSLAPKPTDLQGRKLIDNYYFDYACSQP